MEHVPRRQAEAVGLEPTTGSTRACFRGRFLIQSDGFHRPSSCGDRNRTCVMTINSRLPVPARTPPHRDQLRKKYKHPAGVEPALPPWQGGTRPLHHGCARWPHESCRTLMGHRTEWDQTDLNRHLLG